ncbi:dTDP-4-dehydrorhamnose reductase [Oxalobacteraceae bacterium R-40]|uniref:dTDP-4-dehydrorhamnose reductase n=1 Tax=Keguizhuia sedimenti TaxID=3064264 RepID=A0ABU1BMA3_9BURK|nr:dTDP-4-dehydrorhamnose reductase [Oxalobacteraceae bacterium R-40]
MKILLLGKDGQVGWELQRALSPLGELVALGRQQADLEDLDGLRKVVQSIEPNIIVNAAAYTAVDKAESEPEKAHKINAQAVGILAEEAKRLNAWLVHYSTDYVFDGEKASSYMEDDEPNPLSVYGKTKLAGEQLIRQSGAKYLIFRTSWVFAARGGNFAKTMLRLAKEREQLKVVADQHGAPTSAELIADVTALALHRVVTQAAEENYSGTYHLAASGQTTWHGYARYVVEQALACNTPLKTTVDSVLPIATEDYPLPAKRPSNSRLDTSKLSSVFHLQLPDWRHHVQRMLEELKG